MYLKRLGVICSSIILSIASLFVLAPGIAHAQTFNCLWAGGASGDFNTPANWSNCNSSVPQPGDDLTFDNTSLSGDAIISDDIIGLTVGTITFQGTDSGSYGWTISGDGLYINGGIYDTSNATSNNIEENLELDGNVTFDEDGSNQLQIGSSSSTDTLNLNNNSLTLGGGLINVYSQLEGTGSITDSGNSDFEAAANGYTGNVSIQSGSVYLFDNSALGTGTITVSSGADLETNLSGSSATVSNDLVLAGTGVSNGGVLVAEAGCPGPGNSGSCTGGTTTFSGTIDLLADSTIGAPTDNTIDLTGTVSCSAYTLTSVGSGGTLNGSCGSNGSTNGSTGSPAPKTPDTGARLTKASVGLPLLGGIVIAAGLYIVSRRVKGPISKRR